MVFQEIERAARLLHGASKVLISTGAGMSADSGVPTYRDKEGRWRDFKPFTEKGLRPADFAHPPGYRSAPQHAWAFAEFIRRRMGFATPHKGYDVITRWVTQTFPASFVLTTNIDDFHRRAGVPDVQLYERYGNIWQLQCLARCVPHWWREARTVLCTLDEDLMEAGDFPQCPFCGELARPRIQMAHDEDFIEDEVGWRFYQNFLQQEDAPIDVYVIIGTTLWFSWPEQLPQPKIIHINPDPTTHANYEDPVAITMGAEDALQGIDWTLRQL